MKDSKWLLIQFALFSPLLLFLCRIHNIGCQSQDKGPDSRAVFFEHILYSKRKIADFLSVLDGLDLSLKIIQAMNSVCVG